MILLLLLLCVVGASTLVPCQQLDLHGCSAAVKPNVNVLIPSKTPSSENVKRCVGSLLSKANLTYGAVRFLFGIDWRDELTRATLEKSCQLLNATYEIHPVHGRGGDVSAIANHLFALADVEEYFFRFNDDTEMLTENWNQLAIETLRRPPCNVGIASIFDQTNHALQTHSFVSSMHKHIFGYYFPYHFKNWFEDNWITSTYSGALTKPSGVVIKHHASKERYAITHIDKDALAFAVENARRRVDRFLLKVNAV